MSTTVTIIVGHNVADVETHTTADIVRAVCPLLSDVFTVASGAGDYTASDGSCTQNEACTVIVGLYADSILDLRAELATIALNLGQESIGLVFNATGDDSLVFAV